MDFCLADIAFGPIVFFGVLVVEQVSSHKEYAIYGM